ncbi:MAG TPA: DUF1501 domain-containing protein [Planctomycetota bacterium]|nr:DUF1501 domain-containing protein [Planctomycetota bacterium]
MTDFVSPCKGRPSRRTFLTVSAWGLGSLAAPKLLRARARGANPRASVLFVHLAGGPSHLETYDPKPDAPIEIRGPLGTVRTSLPGVRFGELLPEQARVAHRLAVVRSVAHDQTQHAGGDHIIQTGVPLRRAAGDDEAAPEAPAVGSFVARFRGSGVRGLPAYVAVPRADRFAGPHFLGAAYAPFETGGYPESDGFRVPALVLSKSLDRRRLEERLALRRRLEEGRLLDDPRGVAEGMDRFAEQAFEILATGRAEQAFNIHAEDRAVRERYGRTHFGQCLLLARRLAEAGVPFVTVRDPGWDHHADLVRGMRDRMPPVDRALAALVADVYERGLDRDILIVVTGEFGRTPRMNADGGRDHWPGAYSVVFSGGGLKVGQIVGATTRDGASPASDAYGPQDVLAMIYRHMGIDPGATVEDALGRPIPLLERCRFIRELL